jgi:hypothetical protein
MAFPMIFPVFPAFSQHFPQDLGPFPRRFVHVNGRTGRRRCSVNVGQALLRAKRQANEARQQLDDAWSVMGQVSADSKRWYNYNYI